MLQISALFMEHSGLSVAYQFATLILQSLHVCLALFTGFLVCFDFHLSVLGLGINKYLKAKG